MQAAQYDISWLLHLTIFLNVENLPSKRMFFEFSVNFEVELG